jgi:predicted CoA-substrate-specific enzyme activase
MLILGCDVGAIATKTVIFGDTGIVAYDITVNNGNLKKVVEKSVDTAISKAGMLLECIEVKAGTGMGEQYIPFEHTTEGIIKCLAVAVHRIHPHARTIVDMGGLITTVISISEKGKVLEYRTSDKCASGSGFFLKLAAQALELNVEDLGDIIIPCGERAHMGTQCAVFGESEIVSHMNDGEAPEKIVAGINYSLGSSVATMINRLGGIQDIVATGGVAKNKSVLRAIEEILGMEVITLSSIDEQLVGALGAALCAQQRMQQ